MSTNLERIQKALSGMKMDLSVDPVPDFVDVDEQGKGVVEAFNFGGVYLLVSREENNKMVYSTGYDHHYPGSYDEPPFDDFVEDQEYTDLGEAFGRVLHLLAKDEMSRVIENEIEC